MKFTRIAFVSVVGCFLGLAGSLGACSGGENVTTSGSSSICGDGKVGGTEECDDGNSNDSDACTNACTKGMVVMNTCKDGKLDAGEECDDGNQDDGDQCHNNCTKNDKLLSKCGDGIKDDIEQCDDGNTVAEDGCTNLCTLPRCGDGVIQSQDPYNEDCDDGENNEIAGTCDEDCKNDRPGPSSSSSGTGGSGGDPCAGQKVFAAVVSNATNPMMDGPGIGPDWQYNGLFGINAGHAMCQAAGADHVCKQSEIEKAESNNELSALPAGKTYWMHRTHAVMDPTQPNKTCTVDSDCAAKFCDPKTKVCSYKPGAGGRCNEWTYPTNHISDGEWLHVYQQGAQFAETGVKSPSGLLVYHYDSDTTYDGLGGKTCKSSQLGCGAGCGGISRSILCCFPTCK